MGGIDAQPLHSQGPGGGGGTKRKIRMGYLNSSPSQGPTSGRNCYITLAFSVVWDKRDIIRIPCLTPTFSGAHEWAEMQCNPSIHGGPQQGGQNQNWLPHPRLLGGPQVGGIDA